MQKLLEENISSIRQDIEVEKDFLNRTPFNQDSKLLTIDQ